MRLETIEHRMDELVIALHDLARECQDPIVAGRLRDIGGALSDVAKEARRLAVVLGFRDNASG